jgi:hypothetical protein
VLIALNKQAAQQARCRDDHRRRIVELVGLVPDGVSIYPRPKTIGGLGVRSWIWIAWELLITLVIALAVLELIRNMNTLTSQTR